VDGTVMTDRCAQKGRLYGHLDIITVAVALTDKESRLKKSSRNIMMKVKLIGLDRIQVLKSEKFKKNKNAFWPCDNFRGHGDSWYSMISSLLPGYH